MIGLFRKIIYLLGFRDDELGSMLLPSPSLLMVRLSVRACREDVTGLRSRHWGDDPIGREAAVGLE
jgi:hypothetical protein